MGWVANDPKAELDSEMASMLRDGMLADAHKHRSFSNEVRLVEKTLRLKLDEKQAHSN